jgi:palmitoyl transferase
MVGYAWRARWRPGGGAFSFGGGYTGMLIGREDKLNYAPLPLIVPLGSVGFDHFEVMGVYVPYFELGYFFLRLNFGRNGR